MAAKYSLGEEGLASKHCSPCQDFIPHSEILVFLHGCEIRSGQGRPGFEAHRGQQCQQQCRLVFARMMTAAQDLKRKVFADYFVVGRKRMNL